MGKANKYLALLSIMVFALLTLSHIRGLEIAAAYSVLMAVFFSVFRHNWDRMVGLMLGVLTMAAEVLCHTLPDPHWHSVLAAVFYHALMVGCVWHLRW